jgi:hypothetical protein
MMEDEAIYLQVFVEIGNKGNNLTQPEWSRYCSEVEMIMLFLNNEIYGEFFSLPNAPKQIANFHFSLDSALMPNLEEQLRKACMDFQQDGVSLTIGDTKLIQPFK